MGKSLFLNLQSENGEFIGILFPAATTKMEEGNRFQSQSSLTKEIKNSVNVKDTSNHLL